jgi:hypothetical protein
VRRILSSFSHPGSGKISMADYIRTAGLQIASDIGIPLSVVDSDPRLAFDITPNPE